MKQNNQLQLVRYGPPPDAKEEYYWKVLSQNYNIKEKLFLGCSIEEGIEYYNELMSNEIIKKYGSDFFRTVKEKADSVYKIDEPLVNKIKDLMVVKTSHVDRLQVFETPDKNIKVVCGFKWKLIEKKYWMTNCFRVTINRQNLKIINIDTTRIALYPNFN